MKNVAPITVLASIIFLSGGVSAEDNTRDEAKLHFESGKVLFTNEDFTAAAVEFEASVTLYPTQNGYYNLANCYLALHRYAAALHTLSTLKDRYSNKLSTDMQRRVRLTESTIRKITGEVFLEVVPASAHITVDGRENPPIEDEHPLVLAPGTYTIEFESPGHQPKRLSVTVLAQKRQQIEVELEPAPSPPAKPVPSSDLLPMPHAPEDETTATASSLKPHMWGAAAGAAAAAVTAGVFYGLAAQQQNDAETLGSDWQQTYAGSPEEALVEKEWSTAADRFKIYRNVAYGLTVCSAILAAGAVILRYGKWNRASERFDKVDVSFQPGGVEVRF